jgi:hypothetical protein
MSALPYPESSIKIGTFGNEIACRRDARTDETHADHDVADGEVFVPLPTGHDELGMGPETVEVEGGALRRHLHEALVLGVVEEADGGAALGDARGLVVGRPRRGAAVVRQLVAVGIVSERGAG